MLKVSLIVCCDDCRCLFPFSRFASDDTAAWRVHGDSLTTMAQDAGWTRSECGKFHYCPNCWTELEDMFCVITV